MPGTTARYGFRYQLPADPPDGAALSQNLAEDVEADLAVIEDRLAPLYAQRTSSSSGATSTTLVEVLSVTLPAAGTYKFDGLILLTQSGAVGRPGFALGGTSTATAWRWGGGSVVYNTASGSQGLSTSGTSYPGATGGQVLTAVDWPASTGFCQFWFKGTVTVSVAGTLTFRLSEAAGSGTVTAVAGSMVDVQRVS